MLRMNHEIKKLFDDCSHILWKYVDYLAGIWFQWSNNLSNLQETTREKTGKEINC